MPEQPVRYVIHDADRGVYLAPNVWSAATTEEHAAAPTWEQPVAIRKAQELKAFARAVRPDRPGFRATRAVLEAAGIAWTGVLRPSAEQPPGGEAPAEVTHAEGVSKAAARVAENPASLDDLVKRSEEQPEVWKITHAGVSTDRVVEKETPPKIVPPQGGSGTAPPHGKRGKG